jgi:hypothetical protein
VPYGKSSEVGGGGIGTRVTSAVISVGLSVGDLVAGSAVGDFCSPETSDGAAVGLSKVTTGMAEGESVREGPSTV